VPGGRGGGKDGPRGGGAKKIKGEQPYFILPAPAPMDAGKNLAFSLVQLPAVVGVNIKNIVCNFLLCNVDKLC